MRARYRADSFPLGQAKRDWSFRRFVVKCDSAIVDEARAFRARQCLTDGFGEFALLTEIRPVLPAAKAIDERSTFLLPDGATFRGHRCPSRRLEQGDIRALSRFRWRWASSIALSVSGSSRQGADSSLNDAFTKRRLRPEPVKPPAVETGLVIALSAVSILSLAVIIRSKTRRSRHHLEGDRGTPLTIGSANGSHY